MYETINWDPYKTVESLGQAYEPKPYTRSFLKITLRKSEFFELHSQPQTTVAKGTPEGDETERDNRNYEYLTVGKGKIRRRSDNDAQTDTLLFTTRAVNTIMITKATVSSYVSNFEMYDTLNNITKEFATSTMSSVKDLASALAQTEEGESFEDDETVAEKDKVFGKSQRPTFYKGDHVYSCQFQFVRDQNYLMAAEISQINQQIFPSVHLPDVA